MADTAGSFFCSKSYTRSLLRQYGYTATFHNTIGIVPVRFIEHKSPALINKGRFKNIALRVSQREKFSKDFRLRLAGNFT